MKLIVYRLILIAIGAVIAILFMLHGCSHIESNPNRIDALQGQKDSINLKLKSAYLTLDSLKLNNDSISKVRNKVLTKYVYIHNTLNIHDTVQVERFVNICDSVINIDSTEINSLNKVVSQQGIIMSSQKNVIEIDSSLIDSYSVDLKLAHKEVKKQKRLKAVTFIGGVLAVVATVLVVR